MKRLDTIPILLALAAIGIFALGGCSSDDGVTPDENPEFTAEDVANQAALVTLGMAQILQDMTNKSDPVIVNVSMGYVYGSYWDDGDNNRVWTDSANKLYVDINGLPHDLVMDTPVTFDITDTEGLANGFGSLDFATFDVVFTIDATGSMGDEIEVVKQQIWDIANTLRIAELSAPPLFGLGVDDSHNYFNSTGSTPGRGWVMVRAHELSAEAICEALMAGDFYASSGVVLDEVDFSDGVLSLRIRGEPGVRYRTEFRGTRRGFDRTTSPVVHEGEVKKGVTLRYSSDVGAVLAVVEGLQPGYRLDGDELYVRAVVTADQPPANPVWEAQRQQAWTQPVGWRGRQSPVAVTDRAAVR